MSRFHNLEFGDRSEPRGDQQVPISDAAQLISRAETAFEAGRFEESLRAFAKVLEFEPGNPAAWSGQVRMLIELGDYHEARVWADKAIETCPDQPELLAAKAVALGRSGDLAAALAYSDAALAAAGESPYVWLARADVLLARRERTADFCIEKALALASFDWLTLWLASRLHSVHQQFARALQLALRALDAAADRAVVWLQAGECQLALGLSGAARHSFEQARQLDPDCIPPARSLELARRGLGHRVRGLWRRWSGR
jgi:tetratricopeptide (TPR) repeat protein